MKKKNKPKKSKYHYDPNSFFLDDVLKEVKAEYKASKKNKRDGLTC